MRKNILLIGKGEVGSAIQQIEEKAENKVCIQELDEEAPILAYDVCHVNIPCKDKIEFVNTIVQYLYHYKPLLTIINSTVESGVTKSIKREVNAFGMKIVHSPVRGVHPNLYEGVKTFVKYVGGDEKATKLAKKHFESIGIKCHEVYDSFNTEIAKKLSTTYYNWNIQFCRLIKDICDDTGADFDFVYKDFNKTYNEGYSKLKMNNVIRPILYPPKGKVGGHCQLPNIELLPDSELKTISKLLNLEPDKKNKILKLITKNL